MECADWIRQKIRYCRCRRVYGLTLQTQNRKNVVGLWYGIIGGAIHATQHPNIDWTECRYLLTAHQYPAKPLIQRKWRCRRYWQNGAYRSNPVALSLCLKPARADVVELFLRHKEAAGKGKIISEAVFTIAPIVAYFLNEGEATREDLCASLPLS